MQKVVVAVVVWVAVVFGRSSDASDIVWSGASTEVLVLVGAVVLFVLVLLVVAILAQSHRRKINVREFAEHSFEKESAVARLTPSESILLRSMVEKNTNAKPQDVFVSATLFESAVVRKCQELLASANIEEQEAVSTLLHGIRSKLGYLNLSVAHSTRNLDCGEHLSLFFPEVDRVFAQCSIVHITELYFTVRLPAVDGLECGEDIGVNFTRKGDGYYTAFVEVASIDYSIGEVVFRHSNSLRRRQLRQDVRLVVNLPLHVRILATQAHGRHGKLGSVIGDTIVVDLSGGGLAFESPVSLSVGDTVLLSFYLKKNGFSIRGRISGVAERKQEEKTIYRHGVTFENIRPAEVDGIVKFVFEQQREYV